MNLSKLFMKITKEMGNNHFFGIPGSGVPLDLMDNGRDIGVDFINVAHESSAAIAAGTYGLIKNSAGLALAVKGVGAANLVGGIANAYFERLPVLCVCETTPNYPYENEMVQHTDHKKIMGSLTKENNTISTDNPAKTIIDSFKLAGSDIEGPVLIDFPSDLGLAEVDESIYKENKIVANELDNNLIKKIINIINDSKKPLVIVGDGVRKNNALNEIFELINNINAAVLSTMKARGVYKESKNNWLGVMTDFNENNNTHTGSAINNSDLIINVGVDQMMTHSPWPKNKKKIIEIISTQQNKTISNDPMITYSGDIKEILKSLINNVNSKGWDTEEFKNINNKLKSRFSRPQNSKFTAHDIFDICKTELPPDSNVFTETGAHIRLMEQTWTFDKPLNFFGTSGGRTMGLMIPSFIGGVLATDNNTPSLGIGADGSTLMRLGEFETINRSNLKWPIVIINDGALGTMKYRQGFRGYKDYGLDLTMVDFAKTAKSCGLNGETVDNPEDFRKVLSMSLKSDKTYIIDARIDPDAYQDNFGGTIGD
ncbi:MAG: thiamine pyrophosphate-binding protein [Dehalococcoidia bacterium]